VSEELLVLRRGGATWALPWQEVRGLARRAGGLEVLVAAGALAADEVLGVIPGLHLHPAGAALGRFWPEAARGLAVHGSAPLVLIDASAPPRALLAGGAAAAAGTSQPGAPATAHGEEERADEE
jgi:hypothetical protein